MASDENAYRLNLIDSFIRVHQLIKSVLSGAMTTEEFVKQYNSFYYYEALDGHEADPAQKSVLDEFNDIVEFHRKLQIDIVNHFLVNIDGGDSTQANAKRRSPSSTLGALRVLYDKSGFDELMEPLEQSR